MKTLKNLTLIALVTILLFACEDPFSGVLNPEDSLVTELHILQDANEVGKTGQIINGKTNDLPPEKIENKGGKDNY